MLLQIPDVLSADELQHAQALLASAAWADGRPGAGVQAAQVKNNEQLPHNDDTARTLRAVVTRALERSPLFFSAALPKRLHPPRFNRYGGDSNHYGNHIDGAIRYHPDSGQRVRTDLSCTLFLSDPCDYDGGELCMADTYGTHAVKLPAGHLVLYPGTSLHQVTPVTRGHRVACFFWIESMVRSDEQRRLLFELDMNLTRLRERHGECAETTGLTGTYHNLLRQWADT